MRLDWLENDMIRSITARVRKVWAEERRKHMGTRIIQPKKPKRAEPPETWDDDEHQADLDALNECVAAAESAAPSKDDPAFALVERTWRRRHSQLHTWKTLKAYLEANPYMSSWRMVRILDSSSSHACIFAPS